MVSREEWQAREPVEPPTTIPATNATFIHHTVTPHCTTKEDCSELVRSMQNYHIDSNGIVQLIWRWLRVKQINLKHGPKVLLSGDLDVTIQRHVVLHYAILPYHLNRFFFVLPGWNDIGYNFLVGEDGRVYEGRGWNIWGSHASIYNSMSHGIAVIGNFMDVEAAEGALDTVKNLIQCGVQNVSLLHYVNYTYLIARRRRFKVWFIYARSTPQGLHFLGRLMTLTQIQIYLLYRLYDPSH